ncbi:MAG: ATP-dependent DNA helicase RecG, partial [Alphaproteobacteria bacterium]|nr:ATP-dependent DNA helicase RecG [Alphaproteobacteria bacterium]
DLLWHLPIDFVDRRFSPKVADAPDGKICTLAVRVQKHFPAERKNQPYKVWCTDETGPLTLVFFHGRPDWIKKQLPENTDVIVSGRIEHYNGKPQMVHPDAIVLPEERASIEVIEPVYPLTAGLPNKTVVKALKAGLSLVPNLPEWLDESWKKKQGWSDWDESLRTAHYAENSAPPDSSDRHKEKLRLAYDELLANQLTLLLVRNRQKKQQGRSFIGNGHLRTRLRTALPFTLTGAQERSLKEIEIDMAGANRMLRLLQGDVGAGKTVV